jgi:rhodanese-related sulfurtransferase
LANAFGVSVQGGTFHREVKTMIHSEGFLKLVNDAKSRIREVTVAETQARLAADPNVRLIDVREDNEWDAAHAGGAEHLGKGIIERAIETTAPDKATELILYCGGGYRSALVADVLQQMGYTNVWSMAGGWKAWKDSGAGTEA